MSLNHPDPLEIVAQLRGFAPWGVRLGVGSFLTLEFGAPEERGPGPASHGQMHLWFYMCDWRVEKGKSLITGSEDERPHIESNLRTLELGEVLQVELAYPSLDLILRFVSGAKLLTFSASSSRDVTQWMLFTSDGHCLSVFGDGTYQYAPSSAPLPSRSAPGSH